MVRSVSFVRVADWLNSNVVRQHPDKETLHQDWMAADDDWAARAGWDLTERVAKSPDWLDLPALLARIESEMAAANPEVQWTMNNPLAAVGIHLPKHRKRAIAIGEKLGIYRDYPVSKGCTSPFAPIWINASILGLDLLMDMNWIRTYGSKTRMSVQVSFMSEGGSGTPVPDLSIEVDDLDSALNRLKNGGFDIEYGPVREPWACGASLCATRLGPS